MAQPTTTHPQPAPRQAPTPGIGQTPGSLTGMAAPEGGMVQSWDTAPLDPVLQAEPDMVQLLRLYPHAKSHEELRELAMAAGHAAKEAGLRLRAAQDEETPRDPPPRREA